MQGTTELWYCAYGSNILPGYLGGRLGNEAAPDPANGFRIVLPFDLIFGRMSPKWDGGGVAFLRHVEDPQAASYAFCYPITIGQLFSLITSECGGNKPNHLDIEDLKGTGIFVAGRLSSWYTGILRLGNHSDGVPMVALTSPTVLDEGQMNAPSEGYLDVIRRGLEAAWHLSRDAIDDYLNQAIRRSLPTS